jgi:hypothetical protein
MMNLKVQLRIKFIDFHAILKVLQADAAGNHIPLALAVFLGVFLFLLGLEAHVRI